MKGFRYTAIGFSGQRLEGVRQAFSQEELTSYLHDQGLTPVSIKEITTGVSEAGRLSKAKRVSSAELSAVCWQLNTMLEGGVQIAPALETINEDIENLKLRQVLKEILEHLRAGKTFAQSIDKFPGVFNHLSRAIIKAGETGGSLVLAMQRLAEYYDGRDVLTKKIKGAIAYPIFVFCFVILIVIGIMTFVIPRFEIMFAQFGDGGLPKFTQMYMAFYYAVRSNLLAIIVTVFFLLAGTIVTLNTKNGHRFFSKIILKVPIIGKVVKQSFIAIFCRTMSTLLAAGVPIIDAFDILCQMTNNDIIQQSIKRARTDLTSGASISLSLADAGFFPNMVVKMTQVGEEGGALTKVMERTAIYYERKVDVLITAAMALLEPIMIIVVGAIVLVTVLALYLPIFGRNM